MNKKKHIIIISCLLILSLFLLSGCDYKKVTQMNSYAKSYSKSEIREMAEEYVENKYGQTIQAGDVKPYKDYVYYGYAGKKNAFKGYFIETDDFLTCMAFEQDGTYCFMDNKQAMEITNALQSYIEDSCTCKVAVYSCDLVTSDLESAEGESADFYSELFQSNLNGIFHTDYNRHLFAIYLEPDKNNINYVEQIYDLVDPLSDDIIIAAFKPDIYKTLQPHFSDYNYVRDYFEDENCTALEMTFGNKRH